MKITKVESTQKPFAPENVEVRDSLVEDLVNAEQITGKSNGFAFLAAVASAACIFDGQKVPPEEVRRMRTKDFLELSGELGLSDIPTSPDTSSTLSEKGSLESHQS
jgi:hypothetical protein